MEYPIDLDPSDSVIRIGEEGWGMLGKGMKKLLARLEPRHASHVLLTTKNVRQTAYLHQLCFT